MVETAYLCYLLKKRDNIPWISIFSDPPFHISPFRVENKLLNFIHIILRNDFIFSYLPTKIALRFSDKIIFNDHWQAMFILGKSFDKYKDKVEIIQMPAIIAKENEKLDHDDRIILRYTGDLYMQRNATEFLKALDNLLEKKPEFKSKLIAEFYCPKIPNITKEVYLTMKNKNNVSFYDSVSYQKSIELMKTADILLVLDANLEKITTIYPYTPSKLLDYIGAQKPIFGISMDKSPTHDICVDTDNWWSTFDEKALQESLLDCLLNYKKHKYSQEILFKYSLENRSNQFEAVIDNLLEKVQE
jgi:glycosyltransferase involved in cell wall biosynthesis